MMSVPTKSMVLILVCATTILNVHAQCDESGSGSGSGSGDESGCAPTVAPTVSPATSTPTVSPATSTPTVTPATSTPTVTPATSTSTVTPTTSSPSTTRPTSSPTFTRSPSVSPTEATIIEIILDGNLDDLTADEQQELADEIISELLNAFPNLDPEFITVRFVASSIKAIVTFLPGSVAADKTVAQNISNTLSYVKPLVITLKSNNATFNQIPVTTTTSPTPSPTTPAPTVTPTSSPTARPPSASKTLSEGAVAAIVICVLVIGVLIIVAVVSLSKKDALPKYSRPSSVKPHPDNHIGKLNQGYSTVSMTLADKDTVRITSI